MKTKTNNQLRLLDAQKLSETIPVIVEDYRDAAQRDKSQNFNLFFSHKFDGEKQGNINQED